MTETDLRRIWRESIEHGTLSWKAFKVAARAVEAHVLKTSTTTSKETT